MSKSVKSKRISKKVKLRMRNALEKRATVKNYYPTESVAYRWFYIINKSVFNSMLPNVDIHIKRCPTYWGQCVADWDNRKSRKGTCRQDVIPYENPTIRFYLELSTKFLTWKDFLETLVHEMVHLWQMSVIKDPTSSHNKNFYSWREKLAGINLKL